MSSPTLAEAAQALEFALRHDYPAPKSCRTILDEVYKDHPEVKSIKFSSMRPLGRVQRSVLETLVSYGYWCRSIVCGWTQGTNCETANVLDTLVARGLAVEESKGRYEPTEEGKAVAALIMSAKKGHL